MSNNAKLWGIIRIVDGELCFLGEGDSFAPLDDATYVYERRNDAYEVAQRVHGLLCRITPELALGYALTSTIYGQQALHATSSAGSGC